MSQQPSQSEPKRESIAPRHESLTHEFDGALGSQPRTYGEARLWIVARDAHWIFAYWEFDPGEHPEAILDDGAARFFVRIFRDDGTDEITQEISPAAGDVFIRVTRPDAEYSAELGFIAAGGGWCFLARSGTTRTPEKTGAELVSPAADNGKGIRNLRTMLAAELRAGEPMEAAISRIRDKAAEKNKWTPVHESMLVRLLAADTARAEAQKRKDG